MTAIIRLLPVLGGDGFSPVCNVLQIDDFSILLDCGWTYDFNPEVLEPLKSVIEDVDAILLSHPDIYHAGALPYICQYWNVDVPIYATTPVHSLAQLYLLNALQAKAEREEFLLLTRDDIRMTFEKVQQMQYSEEVHLTGKGKGVTIIPHPAGHVLGGAVWHIQKEEEKIIYSLSYNIREERHLPPAVLAALPSQMKKPRLFITDGAGIASSRRQDREAKFSGLVLDTLRRGGRVMVPVDACGRILELVLIAANIWASNSDIRNHDVIVVSHTAPRILNIARSHMEWMGGKLKADDKPFDMPFLKMFDSFEDLNQQMPQMFTPMAPPALIFAASMEMRYGPAYDLFIRLGCDPANTVIFTDRFVGGRVARDISTDVSGDIRRSITGAPQDAIFSSWEEPEGEELIGCVFRREKARKDRVERLRERQHEVTVEQEMNDPLTYKDAGDGEGEGHVATRPNIMEKLTHVSLMPPGTHDLVVKPSAYTSYYFGFHHNAVELNDELVPQREFPMYPYQPVFIPTKSLYGTELNDAEIRHYGSMAMMDSTAGQPLPDIADANIEREEQQQLLDEWVAPRVFKYETRQIDVQCRLEWIDFEGRTGLDDVKNIIRNAEAKQVLVIRAPLEVKNNLVKARDRLVCDGVTAPNVGEWVNVTSDASVFLLKLKQELLSGVKFIKMKVGGGGPDYELGAFEGAVCAPHVEPDESETSEQHVLELAPVSSTIFDGEPRVTRFVGEIDLKDLQRNIEVLGYAAAFKEKQLVCQGSVEISKTRDGVQMDGPLRPEYFNIRKQVYSRYNII